MNTVEIKLYDLFRKELNLADDKAAAFVSAVEEVVESEMKQDSHANATKDDIRKVEVEIRKHADASKDDIRKVEAEIRKVENEIHKLELKLEQSKTDIYKAVFWTGLVQLIAILGGVLAIVKATK